jgi:hypothetical protein
MLAQVAGGADGPDFAKWAKCTDLSFLQQYAATQEWALSVDKAAIAQILQGSSS